jgi:hypothetical protein
MTAHDRKTKRLGSCCARDGDTKSKVTVTSSGSSPFPAPRAIGGPNGGKKPVEKKWKGRSRCAWREQGGFRELEFPRNRLQTAPHAIYVALKTIGSRIAVAGRIQNRNVSWFKNWADICTSALGSPQMSADDKQTVFVKECRRTTMRRARFMLVSQRRVVQTAVAVAIAKSNDRIGEAVEAGDAPTPLAPGALDRVPTMSSKCAVGACSAHFGYLPTGSRKNKGSFVRHVTARALAELAEPNRWRACQGRCGRGRLKDGQ